MTSHQASAAICCLLSAFHALVLPQKLMAEGLDEQKAWITTHAGLLLVDTNGNAIVIYPRLSIAWQITGGVVTDSAEAVVNDVGSGIDLLWQESGREQLPEAMDAVFTPSTDRHPLARAYDAFLDKPLVLPVGPLPAGTVIESTGTVLVPNETVGSAAQPATLLWRSVADHLEIIGLSSMSELVSASDIAKAVVP